MSVPQRQAGGDKLWDDLDAETFGEHDQSVALSNWADAAKAFEAEMRALKEQGGAPDVGGTRAGSGDEASARRVTFHLARHRASSCAKLSGGCAQNAPAPLHRDLYHGGKTTFRS